jgi:alkanesulfonate monooxygenase SsuD/methylene tetrahydromethanopterin reductase-like flavin-dependent oxidoreductase (luciferase family)
MAETTAPMPMLGLRYDLRTAPHTASTAAQYQACIEQCVWAEKNGFASVTLSEHHSAEDGYLPSPMQIAGVIAGRTTSLFIMIGALLAPLYDPMRLAEDMAVLDLATGGRVGYILGAGYRSEEFNLFNRDFGTRGPRVEEMVGILRTAWAGEPFEFEGRMVTVTPRPLTDHGPMLMLGGASNAAARRAARVGDGFLPVDPIFYEAYNAECEKLGKPIAPAPPVQGPMFLHVAEDPDAAWAKIAPSALHESNSYGAWLQDSNTFGPYQPTDDAETLRASGQYAVLTPDEVVELFNSVGSLSFHPLMGGLAPELGWESLELFAAKVLPRLEAPSF